MENELYESLLQSNRTKIAETRTRLEVLVELSQALVREVEILRADKVNSPVEIDLAKEIETYEADLIRSALMHTGGRQRKAARLLNVKVSTLNAKIKRYKLLEQGVLVPKIRPLT